MAKRKKKQPDLLIDDAHVLIREFKKEHGIQAFDSELLFNAAATIVLQGKIMREPIGIIARKALVFLLAYFDYPIKTMPVGKAAGYADLLMSIVVAMRQEQNEMSSTGAVSIAIKEFSNTLAQPQKLVEEVGMALSDAVIITQLKGCAHGKH